MSLPKTGGIFLRFSGGGNPEIFFQAGSDKETRELQKWLENNFNGGWHDLNSDSSTTGARQFPVEGENGKQEFECSAKLS